MTINLGYCKRPGDSYVRPAEWKDRHIWQTHERATDVVIPSGRTRNALTTRLHEYAHVGQYRAGYLGTSDNLEKHLLFLEAEASAIALQWTRANAADIARHVDCLASHAACAPPLPSCYTTPGRFPFAHLVDADYDACARYLARHIKRIARRFNARAPIVQGRLL